MTVAVIVTYNPPASFLESIDTWLAQVDELLVVDNASPQAWRDHVAAALRDRAGRITFLFNEENIGIAGALNRAFAFLLDRGCDAAFVFDQDSLPETGMVVEILETYRSHPRRERLAIVAPDVSVPSAKARATFLVPSGRFSFHRVRCSGQQLLDNVSIVISSGALYNLQAYREIGPFRDDFFIDYVDTEYCLRARHHGYEIVVACKAVLVHQLGSQKEARFGPLTMHPMYHSPLRWYYISRNRVPMLLEYAGRYPHWFLYELVVNTYGLARLVLFEDHKLAKALAILLGTWDGLNRRMGAASSARLAALMPSENNG